MEKTNGWDALGLEFNANVLFDWKPIHAALAEHELISLLANLADMRSRFSGDVKNQELGDLSAMKQAVSSLQKLILNFELDLMERRRRFYQICSTEEFDGRYALILARLVQRDLAGMLTEIRGLGTS